MISEIVITSRYCLQRFRFLSVETSSVTCANLSMMEVSFSLVTVSFCRLSSIPMSCFIMKIIVFLIHVLVTPCIIFSGHSVRYPRVPHSHRHSSQAVVMSFPVCLSSDSRFMIVCMWIID